MSEWKPAPPHLQEKLMNYFIARCKGKPKDVVEKLRQEVIDTGLIIPKFLEYLYQAHEERIKKELRK